MTQPRHKPCDSGDGELASIPALRFRGQKGVYGLQLTKLPLETLYSRPTRSADALHRGKVWAGIGIGHFRQLAI